MSRPDLPRPPCGIAGPQSRSRSPVDPTALRRRMLLGLLTILTVFYGLATAERYLTPGASYDVRGEALAALVAGFGVCCCLRTPVRGRRYATAVACAATAPIAAIPFHDQLTAQTWAVVPLMFTAIFLRTWHPTVTARIGAAAMSASAVAALLIAPAPVPTLWLILFVGSTMGAAELFGLASSALVDMAMRDPLTNLWNRTGIDRHFDQLLSRARRADLPIAVLLFDIDDFKTINDRDGHPAGDAALRTLAATMAARLPESAALGRIGGDEFIAVVMGFDEPAAEALAVRLADDHQVIVTIGIAVASPGDATASALLSAADSDLYRRKRQRKNPTQSPN